MARFSETAKIPAAYSAPDASFAIALTKFSTPELSGVVKAFASNMRRIPKLAQLPLWMHDLSIHLTTLRLKSLQALGLPADTDISSLSPADQIKVGAKMMEIRAAGQAALHVSAETFEKEAAMTEAGFGAYIDLLGEHAQEAVQMIFNSQIIAAWTAFEILSSDLWVTALNLRPQPLAVQYAKSPNVKRQDRNVSIPSLADYGERNFNLSCAMGDFLVGTKKVDLTSLGTTAEAYERAFGSPLNLFNLDDLKVLDLVRNVIVHNAGIVDRTFLDRRKEDGLMSHRFCANATKGLPLAIDGEVVRDLVKAAASSGIGLIEFVVNYLQSL